MMYVILTTSLFGGVNGNTGDLLPVASQLDADELVRAGVARYATEEPVSQPAKKAKQNAAT